MACNCCLAQVADRIQKFVELKGEPEAIIGKLTEEGSAFSKHPEAEEAVEDMRQLVQVLNCMATPMHRLRQGHAKYVCMYV